MLTELYKQIANYNNENLIYKKKIRFSYCMTLTDILSGMHNHMLNFDFTSKLNSQLQSSFIINKFQIIKFKILLLLVIANFNVFSQVDNILSFQTDGFYMLPSEVGTHDNKWSLSTFVNSKTILKDLPIRSYVIAGDYQIKRGLHSLYAGFGYGTMPLLSSPYHENELYGTLTYHKIIKNHTIHLGIQPGIIFRYLDLNNLLFPDQYDRSTGGFNNEIPSDEPLEFTESTININMNFGLAYGFKFNKFYSKLIIAGRNLNTPNLSFSQNELIKNQQWILQTKTNYYLTNIDIVRAFLTIRHISDKTETFLGGELVHKLTLYNYLMNEVSIGSYVALRNSRYPNNIVFNLGLGCDNLKIGFSYSYNFIGSEQTVSNFNTFELVLTLIGLNNASSYYSVPCEIY